jgi:S1-C subfamily serine protease
MHWFERAKSAVVRVGRSGRGGRGGRGFATDLANIHGHIMPCVITAAHCVPAPVDRLTSPWEQWENTKMTFVGPLDGKTTIAVTILFWDPTTDLAVLGEPDDQALYEESIAYRAIMEEVDRIEIAPLELPLLAEDDRTSTAWALSLEGEWFACKTRTSLSLLVHNAPIARGMSGSPLLNEAGAALGVVSRGSASPDEGYESYSSRLALCLPPRLTSTRPLTTFKPPGGLASVISAF